MHHNSGMPSLGTPGEENLLCAWSIATFSSRVILDSASETRSSMSRVSSRYTGVVCLTVHDDRDMSPMDRIVNRLRFIVCPFFSVISWFYCKCKVNTFLLIVVKCVGQVENPVYGRHLASSVTGVFNTS